MACLPDIEIGDEAAERDANERGEGRELFRKERSNSRAGEKSRFMFAW